MGLKYVYLVDTTLAQQTVRVWDGTSCLESQPNMHISLQYTVVQE